MGCYKCKQERRIVRPEFQNLGIESIYDLCLKNNGFILEEKPNEKEIQYIQVLEKGAKELFSDIISLDDFPECRILLNEEAPCVGFTKVVKYHNDKRNTYGLKVMRYAKYVCIKRNLILDSKDLESESFDNTFIKFVDILLHTYGSSRSNKMNLMLTALGEFIIKYRAVLDSAREIWNNL